MQFTRGQRYVGGFVGSDDARERWLRPQVEKWAEAVRVLGRIAVHHPQAAYCGLAHSLQSEWQYLQRVVPGIGDAFGPVEEAICKDFLPKLFGVESITDDLRALTCFSVKRTGLGIPDPTTTAERCHDTSAETCEVLTASMVEGVGLSWTDHRKCARTAAARAKRDLMVTQEQELVARCALLSQVERHRMQRRKKSGRWLTTIPATLNGTRLSCEEFRDNLRLRYEMTPENLQERCDGCGSKFSVGHALDCKCGGLVMVRHNDVTRTFGGMLQSALGRSAVTYEPFIEYGRTPSEREQAAAQDATADAANDDAAGGSDGDGERGDGEGNTSARTEDQATTMTGSEDRADVSGHGFWKPGFSCLFDSRVTNLDCRSQRHTDPDNVLARHEKLKKGKYLGRCLKMRRHFTPLVYSCDGVPGTETAAAEKQLARLLAEKWTRDYSEMCGYVRTRMALAVVRSNTMMLRGPRTKPICTRPIFDDGAGFQIIAASQL